MAGDENDGGHGEQADFAYICTINPNNYLDDATIDKIAQDLASNSDSDNSQDTDSDTANADKDSESTPGSIDSADMLNRTLSALAVPGFVTTNNIIHSYTVHVAGDLTEDMVKSLCDHNSCLFRKRGLQRTARDLEYVMWPDDQRLVQDVHRPGLHEFRE